MARSVTGVFNVWHFWSLSAADRTVNGSPWRSRSILPKTARHQTYTFLLVPSVALKQTSGRLEAHKSALVQQVREARIDKHESVYVFSFVRKYAQPPDSKMFEVCISEMTEVIFLGKNKLLNLLWDDPAGGIL